MKRNFALPIAMLIVSTFFLSGTAMGDELIVGSDAPEFSLTGSDGKTYKLSDFKDKKHVVIAWFPKAFTGG